MACMICYLKYIEFLTIVSYREPFFFLFLFFNPIAIVVLNLTSHLSNNKYITTYFFFANDMGQY